MTIQSAKVKKALKEYREDIETMTNIDIDFWLPVLENPIAGLLVHATQVYKGRSMEVHLPRIVGDPKQPVAGPLLVPAEVSGVKEILERDGQVFVYCFVLKKTGAIEKEAFSADLFWPRRDDSLADGEYVQV